MGTLLAESQPVQNPTVGSTPIKANFWGMMRDVLIVALNKGQLLPTMLGFIIMAVLIKMPSTYILRLFQETISLFKSLYTLGWAFTIILVPSFVYLYNKARKLHQNEVDRLNRLLENK